MPRDDESESDSLSIRQSIVVWAVCAVVGWGAAVVAVYGVLRYTGEPQVAQEQEQGEPSMAEEAEKLQEISPAAGEEDVEPPAAAEGETADPPE